MRHWCLATLLLVSTVSVGLYAEALRELAEASLMVEGKVLLNPDGTVASYTLREPEKLPEPVVDLIQQSLPSWKLQFYRTPVAPVEESMTLRIVAKDIDRKHTTIRIAGAQFQDESEPKRESIHSLTRVQPTYPRRSREDGMSGTVYLLVRVGPDGKVLDAAAEQVNLHRYTQQNMLDIYRKDLASAAVKAAAQWTFSVPSEGPSAKLPCWYVRMPVHFHITNSGYDEHNGSQYGSWEIYVRGPRETIPWVQDKLLLAQSPDATPDGTLHQLGSGAELMTPLAPN
jgi:TonB family protein